MNKRHFLRHASLGMVGLTAPFLPANARAAGLSQSRIVYRDGNEYVLIGSIDRKETLRDPSAARVIQTAVDQLTRGGYITLESGDYWLDRQINLNSRVHLSGRGESSRLIFQPDHDTGIALRGEEADRAVVSHLAIFAHPDQGTGQTGVLLTNCGDCHVQDVFVTGVQKNGIHLDDDCFLCTVRGCRIANAGQNGILLNQLFGGGRGGDYVPNLISDCSVYGGRRGITLQRAIVINITGCMVYQASETGLHLSDQSHSVSITGCRTFQIGGDALHYQHCHEVNVSGNIFCWHEGHGIVLDQSRWGSIVGNNIIDSGSTNVFDEDEVAFVLKQDGRPFRREPTSEQRVNDKNGIWLRNGCKGLTLSGNAIFNWPVASQMKHGILEDDTCQNNVIVANNLNYFRQGVVSQGEGSQVSNNKALGDQPYAGMLNKGMQYFDPRLLQHFIKNQYPA